MATKLDVEDWLREQCADYKLTVSGVYRGRGDHAWPLTAVDEDDLLRQLDEGGHILPLPKESAALANVLEVDIVTFLTAKLEAMPGAIATGGTERGYPDLEIAGEVFGGGFHAIDIKMARRGIYKNGKPKNSTNSAITLYTGNTYFKHPDLHYPSTMRPFNDYKSHLDVIGIYTLVSDSGYERVRDLELIVQQPWKIASKNRSSTTREYIGAVQDIDALREGNGVFSTPEEFYTYWRKYPFKIAPATVKLMEKGLLNKP